MTRAVVDAELPPARPGAGRPQGLESRELHLVGQDALHRGRTRDVRHRSRCGRRATGPPAVLGAPGNAQRPTFVVATAPSPIPGPTGSCTSTSIPGPPSRMPLRQPWPISSDLANPSCSRGISTSRGTSCASCGLPDSSTATRRSVWCPARPGPQRHTRGCAEAQPLRGGQAPCSCSRQRSSLAAPAGRPSLAAPRGPTARSCRTPRGPRSRSSTALPTSSPGGPEAVADQVPSLVRLNGPVPLPAVWSVCRELSVGRQRLRAGWPSRGWRPLL